METFEMKTSLSLLSAALLLTSASSVFAASSVDLTVKGLITPSACAPSLSSGGVIDHGKVAAKDLKLDGYTLLGNHTLQLAITCDAPTLLALKGIDNQGSAYDSSNAYGLGLVSGKKLGGYTLALDNPMADGAVISVIGSRDNGLSWREIYPGDVWPAADLASFGDRSTGSWAPAPVQQVTAGLWVQTIIAPTAGMDLTTEVPIYGSATIEVKYL
ncbi:DUF1120 domain-containing protein [Pseudomonas sp. PA-6-3C]|jgi:type 1 fimbria pilin|nr:DUF1120 domain-containing protein [Pseudomonas sp. PA-6-3C]MCF5148090.1 DUF1120 domain-containing protein [Pseudomonas sp. PA-6-3F]MCF5158981.1 DUF1120 domain-containing protein [Pseudomonas sp. PA-6-2E]MCF5195860.1 DUF1120 domain-containing protein [Pseudomonas sp. PA-6-1H]MCF8973965.1 DUF1120 domain-containing protein [Pseudomonas edaphica]